MKWKSARLKKLKLIEMWNQTILQYHFVRSAVDVLW